MSILKKSNVLVSSLSHRVVTSLLWVFGMHGVDRILWLVKMIVLTRFLAPSDFGLMGMAFLAVFSFELFSQVGGFADFLVQKSQKIDRYLNVLWTIQVIQGLIFALIFFFSAAWLAVFFKMPELKSILQAISLGFVFVGLTNARVIFFRKNLHFHKEFFYIISGALTDMSVTTIVVTQLHNVWAMVIGFLAGSLIKLIISYVLSPYWPRFVLRWQLFREMFNFGKWIFLYRLVYFANTKGVDLFVGRFLGAAALGLYQMSYRFSGAIGLEFSIALNKVTFPAYSKVKKLRSLVATAYLKAIKFSACFSFPLGVTFFVLAPTLINLLFGPAWSQMINSFRIFAALGLILPILSTGDSLFLSKGKPRLVVFLSLVKLILIFSMVWPLARAHGIVGAALAVLIVNCAMVPLWLWFSWREIGSRIWELGRIFTVIGLSAILMALTMFFLTSQFQSLDIRQTIFVVFFSLIIFALSVWLWGKLWRCQIVEELGFFLRNLH